MDSSQGLQHKQEMKKELPEIRESVEALSQRLRTEQQGRRRSRLYVLYLLKSGQAQTRQEVAVLVPCIATR